MDTEALHDLTAPYALHALDSEEAQAYERHLAHCDRCRRELADLSETATALAYAADGPAPPAGLRDRILDAARAERPNVVPLRPRWAVPVAATAIVAVAAAVVLAIWATSLSRSLDDERSARRAEQRAAAIVGDPAAHRVDIADGRGSLYVTPSGSAALVLARLQHAHPGRTYEAWIAEAGGKPKPAGTFEGGAAVVTVPLEGRVPDGAQVMVTEEQDGGVDAPTTTPFVSVKNAPAA
jgi:Anti-sigma-K factor rskA, C-terminal/Anti-sigma-K factor RskA, N-terminal domain